MTQTDQPQGSANLATSPLRWHRLSAGFYVAEQGGTEYHIDRYEPEDGSLPYFLIGSNPVGDIEYTEIGMAETVRYAKLIAQEAANEDITEEPPASTSPDRPCVGSELDGDGDSSAATENVGARTTAQTEAGVRGALATTDRFTSAECEGARQTDTAILRTPRHYVDGEYNAYKGEGGPGSPKTWTVFGPDSGIVELGLRSLKAVKAAIAADRKKKANPPQTAEAIADKLVADGIPADEIEGSATTPAAPARPTREGPGSYRYRGWIVNKVDQLGGQWVAYREDDRTWVLDPLPTLRETLAAIDYNPDPGMADERNPATPVLTTASHDLFMELARDAGNWSGTPLVGGNTSMNAQLRGNLSDLVQKGLVTIFKEYGDTWVNFTEQGVAYAAAHGVGTHLANLREY